MSKSNDPAVEHHASPSVNEGDLLRAVSSETRQPLLNAKSFCQMLLSEKPGGLADEQQQLIRMTLREIERVEQAISFAIRELNRIGKKTE